MRSPILLEARPRWPPVSVNVEELGRRWLAHEEARPGQREMIHDGIEALWERGHLVAAAPTGIGKTAASLAAALAVAREREGRCTVMFLTSRQSQHRIVVETVRSMNDRRLPEDRVSLVDMIGQAGMCVQPFADERPAVFSLLCANARKTRSCRPYITPAPSLPNRILASPLHVEELVELTRHHREHGEPTLACPWRVAREAAARADVVVADYNHLFNEGVRDSTLAALGLTLEQLIIVVDEAHNLPERIRSGLERRLTPLLVRNAKPDLEEHVGNVSERLGRGPHTDMIEWTTQVIDALAPLVQGHFARLHTDLAEAADDAVRRRRKGERGVFEPKELEVKANDLLALINQACDTVDGVSGQTTLTTPAPAAAVERLDRLNVLREVLRDAEVEVDPEATQDAESDAQRLGAVLDDLVRFGDTTGHLFCFSPEGRAGRITSHLLDPGLVSGPVLNASAGAVLMSGTLYPPSMYADLLNLPVKRTTIRSYPSPFASQRRPVVVATDVTTTYRQRSPANTARMQEHLRALIQAAPGHVAVFAPSYALLEEIVTDAHWPVHRTVVESSDWDKSKADEVLDTLEREREAGRKVLLAGTFGARLSEGVDYRGGLLDAVACIGLPIAPPGVVQDGLKAFVGERFGKDKSWRYTMTQPAVNRVLQAMGRPIRGIDDRAVVLLLEQRCEQPMYRKCFPGDLQMVPMSDPNGLKRLAERFYRRVPRVPTP